MIALIECNRGAIVELCKQYGVQRLAVFGSAVKRAFDSARGALDLMRLNREIDVCADAGT